MCLGVPRGGCPNVSSEMNSLVDMSPCNAVNDRVYSPSADTEFFPYLLHSLPADIPLPSDLAYFFRRQLTNSVRLSFCASALSAHVRKIVGVRALEEMARITAGRIVALMTQQSLGLESCYQKVGHAMGAQKATMTRRIGRAKYAVTSRRRQPQPRPAFIVASFVDFLPKPSDMFSVKSKRLRVFLSHASIIS